MTESLDPERAAELRQKARDSMDELFARSRTHAETPLTTEEIAELADEDLDDRVWLRLSAVVDYFDPVTLGREDPDIAAYLSTRVFEWEVGNGGLHQYFFNFPDPDHVAIVLEGYSRLGLSAARQIVEDIVAPVASAEGDWREALRDGSIETFFASYIESRLPDYDERIAFHDAERVALVRAHAAKFAR